MRRLTTTLVRTAVLGFLALAIAGVELPARAQSRHWIYLLDVSAGIPERGSGDGLSVDDGREIVKHHQTTLPTGDVATVILFGKNVVPGLEGTPRIDRAGTDIAAAIRAALTLPDEGRQSEIILLSDGNDTSGDLDASLRSAARMGRRIHTIPLGRLHPSDAAIVDIRTPPSVKPGETFDAAVTLRSTTVGAAKLRLLGDGSRTLREIESHFAEPGERRTVVIPRLDPSGGTPFRIVMEPAFADDCPENNAASFSVRVSDEKTKVLCISPRITDPPSASLLRANANVDLTVSATWRDPFTYDVVLLETGAIEALSEPQMKDLRGFVESFGGGLLLLGGPNTFALGGLAGTPVEAVSPLWAFPDETLTALFLLDVSGSMAKTIPDLGKSKLDAARDAVISSLRLLRDDDAVGLIAFTGSPVSSSPPSPRKNPEPFIRALRSQTASGQTSILPAVDAAAKSLAAASTSRRRIILLTDGQSDGSIEAFAKAGDALVERRFPITIIAVGDEIDRGKLQALAGPGNELIHMTDLADLAGTIGRTLSRSKDLVLEEAAPLPVTVVDPAHALLAGVGTIPPIGKLNRTALKEGAEALLAVRETPLLAMRQCGRGRSIAFASNLFEGWGGEWGNWGETWRLFNQIVGACGDHRISNDAEIEIAREGDSMKIDIVGGRGAPLAGPVGTWRNTPDGSSGEMTFLPSGIDRWSAAIERPAPGTWFFRINDGGRAFQRQYHILYTDEFAAVGVDRKTLDRIASETGGESPVDIDRLKTTPVTHSSTTPGAPFFLIAAVALFVIDILIATFWR